MVHKKNPLSYSESARCYAEDWIMLIKDETYNIFDMKKCLEILKHPIIRTRAMKKVGKYLREHKISMLERE